MDETADERGRVEDLHLEAVTIEAEKAQHHEAQMSILHEVAFIFTICMAQILALSGLGMALSSIYVIGESFGVNDPGQLSWYLAGFSLTVGTFILPSGRLGDMFGHKKIFLIGTLWYGTWSLVAGFSVYQKGNQGSILFSVARGFQGIGPSLMVPNALAIAGRSFEGRKKNLVFALFGASAPGGAILGGLFSAIFGQLSFWPWTFWMMGMVCFAYTATSFLILPADDHNPGLEQCKPSFDFAGTVTGVSGLVIFNFAWNQAAVVGWNTPYTYILLLVGLLFFMAFLYIEIYVADYPLVPIKSLSKEAIYALSIIACGWASFGIWVYYLFQLLQHIRGHSLLSTVAQQSPVAVSGFFASLAVGFFLSKVKVAYIMFAAMCCFLIGQTLLATAPVNQTYWAQTFISILIMPWGMDLSFPCGTIILSNAMPREHQGIAASLINTVVNYSISLSLGVAGTIIRYTQDHATEIETYRYSWYFAIGLDAIGMAIAMLFLVVSIRGKTVS